jgi:hypothetical protein
MKKIILLITIILTSALAGAQVILETGTLTPSLNETFRLGVTFADEEKEDYVIQGLDQNFQILSRGSQSSYSIVNGKSSGRVSDIYELLPLKEGEFKLKAVATKGKKSVSNEVTLKVSKSAAVSQGQGAGAAAGAGGIEFRTNLRDQETFYFGEKIPYSEKLLTTRSILGLSIPTPASFGEFSARRVPGPLPDGSFPTKQVRTADGQTALDATLFQWILEANASGDKTIQSSAVSVDTEDFMRGRRNVFPAQTLRLKILPLPDGKPADFRNVVGKLRSDFSWNTDKIKFGETVVLTVNLSGAVNLDLLEVIAENLSGPDYNVYESVKSSSETVMDGQYYAEKTFEVVFVPKVGGDITLPSIAIPYFNTDTKRYDQAVIPEKKIRVEGSAQQAAPIPQQVPAPSAPVAPMAPAEKIEISTLPAAADSGRFGHRYGKIFLFVCISETFVLLYLLCKRRGGGTKAPAPAWKLLASSRDDGEFYENYCAFMKEKFRYSPKVHLEDRLAKNGAGAEILTLNREIEESRALGKPLDRPRITKILKKI